MKPPLINISDCVATVETDQHSQLQLYLDGPNDKLVTFLMVKCAGSGPALTADQASAIRLDAAAGRTVGDFVWAQQRATADTLVKACRLVRRITLQRVDAEAIGALMMHFMLETIIAARLLRVDAFDQPAVEDGKVLAKDYLARMAPGRKSKRLRTASRIRSSGSLPVPCESMLTAKGAARPMA